MLTLVTMQRPDEVASRHRRDIDGSWWTIPTPVGARADRGQGAGLPIPIATKSQHIGRGALASLLRGPITERELTKEEYYGLPRWTTHDLRRTGRTALSRLQVLREATEAVIAHSKGVINC